MTPRTHPFMSVVSENKICFDIYFQIVTLGCPFYPMLNPIFLAMQDYPCTRQTIWIVDKRVIRMAICSILMLLDILQVMYIKITLHLDNVTTP